MQKRVLSLVLSLLFAVGGVTFASVSTAVVFKRMYQPPLLTELTADTDFSKIKSEKLSGMGENTLEKVVEKSFSFDFGKNVTYKLKAEGYMIWYDGNVKHYQKNDGELICKWDNDKIYSKDVGVLFDESGKKIGTTTYYDYQIIDEQTGIVVYYFKEKGDADWSKTTYEYEYLKQIENLSNQQFLILAKELKWDGVQRCYTAESVTMPMSYDENMNPVYGTCKDIVVKVAQGKVVVFNYTVVPPSFNGGPVTVKEEVKISAIFYDYGKTTVTLPQDLPQ